MTRKRKETFKPEAFPVRVTLGFRSEEEKRYVMGQLSDGWGENHVDLEWPWRSGVEFHSAELIGVRIGSGEDKEIFERQKRTRKRLGLEGAGE